MLHWTFAMAVRSCRVTVTDLDGIAHTASVTASSLYEAVALGLKAIRGSDWVGEIAESSRTVHVSVSEVAVEHTVKLKEFRDWLDRPTGSPREIVSRHTIRGILGLQ
jgi:hypothetical protein